MTQNLTVQIAELRSAAKQARALSESMLEAEAKWGFAELAAKWEAEALSLEQARK